MSEGREITDYLDDIRSSIADVEEFTRGMSYDAFVTGKKTINAVIRSLEVLGEATKHIPDSFRVKNPMVPWTKMAGLRDVLIHDYMGVDLKTIWNVVQHRLPKLRSLLKDVFL